MKAASLTPERMTADEHKAAFWLAGVFSLRMLGLFMILPVFVDPANERLQSCPCSNAAPRSPRTRCCSQGSASACSPWVPLR